MVQMSYSILIFSVFCTVNYIYVAESLKFAGFSRQVQSLSNQWLSRGINKSPYMLHSSVNDDGVPDNFVPDSESEGVTSVEIEGDGDESAAESGVSNPSNVTSIEEDPVMKQIKEMELKLSAEVSQLEMQLRSERQNAARIKDQISESGKNGYFIIQAQVAEFLKRNENDQKSRVAKNKREFVLKMLGVVDGFRQAPMDVPGDTEREQNMHKSFGALLNGILAVFEKYGFKEISPEVGTPIDPLLHEVRESAQEGAQGVVLRQISVGWMDSEGFAIRKAAVVANVPGTQASEELPTKEEDAPEEKKEE